MSITGYRLILPLVAVLLFGCGKHEVPTSIPEDYPDGMKMFLSVWQKETAATAETTAEGNGKEPLVNHISRFTQLGNFVVDRKKLREEIHEADFSEINLLVGNGDFHSAVRKLNLMKARYRENPFVIMECSMYLADIHNKQGSQEWKKQMDDVVGAYDAIKKRKDVKSVFQQSFDNDEFVQSLYPTGEVTDNVH